MAKGLDIAIIGMACKFPGAHSTKAFWSNLRGGVESIIRPQKEPTSVKPGQYVSAAAVLDEIDRFDAEFFGYSRLEAEIMDPQQRLFLECAWQAVEDAGYAPRSIPGIVGVFAGAGTNSYFVNNVHPARGFRRNRNFLQSTADLQLTLGNDRDYLATRVSHRLNLRGLSVNVQTACSTSLVAVHLACQSLLNGDCDSALAGAANIMVPQLRQYLYEEGLVYSPDGTCRAFDADSNGTVFGSGVGAVLLKPLDRAVADRDSIYAVIKGSAANNDGSDKVGFTAPSVAGQATVIAEALAFAQVSPRDLKYIEAHGTATTLGDSIEIEALGRVFGPSTDKYCAIGSVKTNIGHLAWAAGIASLIKTALVLFHREIPPTLHFKRPNPKIGWDKVPFFVNDCVLPYIQNVPMYAGVSAFGIGGTNAHVVLGEPPTRPAVLDTPERSSNVLKISARSAEAVRQFAGSFMTHLKEDVTASPADIAYTANTGRHEYEYRVAVRGGTSRSLAAALKERLARAPAHSALRLNGKVAFLFTGLGAEYPGMGKELYNSNRIVRSVLDRMEYIYRSIYDRSLLAAMFGESGELTRLGVAQPAVYALGCALTDLWRSWGVEANMVIGHSLGEYVAAYAAGVIQADDGLRVVAKRGTLMDELGSNGGMIVVKSDSLIIAKYLLGTKICIAAENSPMSTVLSGERQELDSLAEQLRAAAIEVSHLNIKGAGHSNLMLPILPGLVAALNEVTLKSPKIPIVSNTSGNIAGNDIVQADYWIAHTLGTVRFRDCISTTVQAGVNTFIEIGPQPHLTGLGMGSVGGGNIEWIASLWPRKGEWASLCEAICQVYEAGVSIDWAAFDHDWVRFRQHIPTYPFQRQSYWIESGEDSAGVDASAAQVNIPEFANAKRIQDAGTRSYASLECIWLDSHSHETANHIDERWIIVTAQQSEVAATLSRLLVWPVTNEIAIISINDPRAQQLLTQKLRDIAATKVASVNVIFLAPVVANMDVATESLDLCNGLLNVIRACVDVSSCNAQISLVTQEAVSFKGDLTGLASSSLWGFARVAGIEHPYLGVRRIDVDFKCLSQNCPALARELRAGDGEDTVVLRDGHRFVGRLRESEEIRQGNEKFALDADAVYVITGGFGGLGVVMAEWLAARGAGYIVLVGIRPPKLDAAQRISVLRARGHNVIERLLDVSNPIAIQELFKELSNTHRRVAGVVHAAGTIDDGVILRLNRDRFDNVMRVKVGGAVNIYESLHACGAKPDFFVLFSSATSLVGNAGQANHAAANAFLDAFAHWCRLRGQRAVSINWGAWGDAGRLAVDSTTRAQVVKLGYELIETKGGLEAIERVILGGAAQTGVAPANWRRALIHLGLSKTPFYDYLMRPSFDDGLSRDSDDGTEDPISTEEILRQEAGRLLGLGAHEIDDNVPLVKLGLDSLGTIQLCNAVHRRLGRTSHAFLAFRFATLSEMKLAIDEKDADVEPRDEVTKSNEESQPEIPLSTQQQRWLSLIANGYGGRVVPVVFWSNLNASALYKALLSVVSRHDLLRYRYPRGHVEVLKPSDVVPAPNDLVIDLAQLSAQERQEQVSNIYDRIRTGLSYPALTTSWKAQCVRLSPERFALLLGLQHIEFEGTSLSSFVDELRELYWAFSNGEAASLPEAVQYRDYTIIQREYLLRAGAKDGAFFAGLFSGMRGIPTLPGHAGFAKTRALPSRRYTPPILHGLWEELRRYASASGVTPFSVVLAAYAKMVGEVIGSNDVVISMITSSRGAGRFADTVGPFTSPVPVRIASANEPLTQSALRCHDLVAAIGNRNLYSVTKLPEDVNVFNGFPVDSYFSDVGINFSNYRKQNSTHQLKVEILEILGNVKNEDFSGINTSDLLRIPGLHLVVTFTPVEADFNFWYHSNRFQPNQVAQWADRFLQLLTTR